MPVQTLKGNTFDHPTWKCKDCETIFHEEPVWSKGYSFKVNGSWQFKGCARQFCPQCGGDVQRNYDGVPLAISVRPVPPLKGQRDMMWRWRCYDCGRVSEFAWGSRRGWRWTFGKGYTSEPRSYTHIEKCIPCGHENRIVFNE